MYSCTPEGASTGIIIALNKCSLWCGMVEDFAAWSSPATASTPPNFEVPQALAFLNKSPQRSTPGPLPYPLLNTPPHRTTRGPSPSHSPNPRWYFAPG